MRFGAYGNSFLFLTFPIHKEFFIVIHYSCDRCKRDIDGSTDLRYTVTIEIEAALDSIPARLIWAEMDGSIPMDVATAVRFVRDWRTRNANSSAERDRDVVESAWEARAKGLSIRAWIETRKPSDAGEVRQLSRLLGACPEFCVRGIA